MPRKKKTVNKVTLKFKQKKERREVDPIAYMEDFNCLWYAMLGVSTKGIVRQTGLTVGKTSYRLSKYGIKRKHFRDGQSLSFQMVKNAAGKGIADMLRTQLLRKAAKKRKKVAV